MDYGLRQIGQSSTVLTATTGTIACSNSRQVNVQAVMDTNSTYEVALKATQSAVGTASKGNCAAVVTDGGVYECKRPAGGSANYWIAYQVYNGASAAAGGAADRLIVEKLG